MAPYVLDFCSLSAIILGVFVITAKNPVLSVLFLIAVFLNVAVYLVLHGVAYLGLAYIIVYIGAIAILFLFVIIMLNINVHLLLNSTASTVGEFAQTYPLASVLSLLFMWQIYSILIKSASWSIISSYYFSLNVSLDSISANYLLTHSVPVQSPLTPAVLSNLDALSKSEYISYTGLQVASDSLFTTFSQIENIGTSIYGYNAGWLIITSIILLVGIVGPILLCIDNKPNIDSAYSIPFIRY